ncbi:Rid family hydrolase [Ancylobacter sp. MQZ15Z-1]|uniref:Rid family hydrolase n=1 Tax=Ancylobacter mangrovi TaxID=2972472 RepID=A0A9X2T393_9HYPH|nr:Rid family hydrolase [Ancylobacter mangrovi]
MSCRQSLQPAELPTTPYRAAGLRYKNWVFVSGTMATDFKTGLPASARANDALPLAGEHVMIRETRFIFETLGAVLRAGGTTMDQAVRIDSFPTTRDAIDPYHVVRREFMDPPRPASTSVAVDALLAPQASTQVELVAIVPQDDLKKEGIDTDRIPQPLGGYSPAVVAGDFVFLAGQVPTDWKTGVAPEAKVDPNFWEGNQIDRQARLTLKNMAITLEAAGSSLEDVVKVQVYLADITDVPRFDRVWREFFPKDAPARTIYPIRALGVTGGRIEINFVALRTGGKTRKQVISTPEARHSPFGETQAVRAGDFLFLSGLMAVDDDGLVAAARANPAYPHDRDPAAAQMSDIMEQAQAICRAAGTDLKNAVRMLTVHTDLSESFRAATAASPFFPDGPPATTTVGVQAPLQAEEATIMVDLWVAMSA